MKIVELNSTRILISMTDVGRILLNILDSPMCSILSDDDVSNISGELNCTFNDITYMIFTTLYKTLNIEKKIFLQKLDISSREGDLLTHLISPNSENISYSDFHIFCKRGSTVDIKGLIYASGLEKQNEFDGMSTIYELNQYQDDEEKMSIISDSSWGADDELDYVDSRCDTIYTKHHARLQTSFWEKIESCIKHSFLSKK